MTGSFKRCDCCGDDMPTGRRNLCDPCWYRVPLELRRAYAEATSSQLGHRKVRNGPNARAARDAITAWVKANPVTRERGEPLWRRPRTR